MKAEQLSLFAPERQPSWDDVQKGRAELVTEIEPCDQCINSPMKYWRDGECIHTAKDYAYPLSLPGGMCRKSYIRWKS